MPFPHNTIPKMKIPIPNNNYLAITRTYVWCHDKQSDPSYIRTLNDWRNE